MSNRLSMLSNLFGGLRRFLGVVLFHAPEGSTCGRLAKAAPLFSVHRWTCQYPAPYALWREFRSAALRTLDRHERGLSYENMDVRLIGTECHQTSIECKIRIRGIQNLRMRRPWATPWDELLYLEGLTDGLALNDRTGKSSCQLAYDVSRNQGDNMMPPAIIPRDSKT
jgi:hypothetical protein